jgi:hypothetical protein
MNWYESSEIYRRHALCLAEARLLWEETHGPEPCNITLALEELAGLLGLPGDYFVMTKTVTPEKIAAELNGLLVCPECGGRLDFELTSPCPQANPNRYSGLFACSSDDCPFHFYTKAGLLDVRNDVRNGRWPDGHYPTGNSTATPAPDACPICGGGLLTDLLAPCPRVNPQGYDRLVFCESETCPYHHYQAPSGDIIPGVLP